MFLLTLVLIILTIVYVVVLAVAAAIAADVTGARPRSWGCEDNHENKNTNKCEQTRAARYVCHVLCGMQLVLHTNLLTSSRKRLEIA